MGLTFGMGSKPLKSSKVYSWNDSNCLNMFNVIVGIILKNGMFEYV